MKRALLLLTMLAAPAHAGIITYVQTQPAACSTTRCDALGYPVPRPLETQMPADGFRSYAALQARLADLALTSPSIDRATIGQTLAGRPIYAYVLGAQSETTREGFPRPAMLQNGGIHAREWASPEVVGGIVERFAANENDAALYRYLLDNTRVVLVPSLNVDGFLQTQRFPDRALVTEFTPNGQDPDSVHADPPDWPRDGRMRRKNMNGADEALDENADGMLGTDNNRNNPPYFDSGVQNSDDGRSLVYHGLVAGAELENRALYAAAALGPQARLRLYIDTHSFNRTYFGVETGNARHDRLARTLWQTMNAVTANRYDYAPTPAGMGIGSTDEYFAYASQVPAYTLEIEPGPSGASDYPGAFGVTHDGFILPEAQIARVREELATAAVAGYYRMAGPPVLLTAQIGDSSGVLIYDAHWQKSSDIARQLVVATRSALVAETDYTLRLGFDKPMRVRDAGGVVTQYRGQQATLTPSLALEGIAADGAAFQVPINAPIAGWQNAGYANYQDATYVAQFRIPAGTPLAGARRLTLKVDAQDFTGQALDANPATASDLVSGGWARYEDASGSDTSDSGGADRTQRLIDDGSPPFAPPAARFGGKGGSALPLWLLLWGALALMRRRA